jgi:hypothetical protein
LGGATGSNRSAAFGELIAPALELGLDAPQPEPASIAPKTTPAAAARNVNLRHRPARPVILSPPDA